MSAPRKITSGHHIQFSSYINRLREGAARSKYGSRIACTDRFFWGTVIVAGLGCSALPHW